MTEQANAEAVNAIVMLKQSQLKPEGLKHKPFYLLSV